MIRYDGWAQYCIWEHSADVRDLYARRCRREAEEMTAHAQAAELLAPRVTAGDTLLDAGCGAGYFFHSLTSRNIPVEYTGVDAAPSLIALGRDLLKPFGLAADRLQCARLEDLTGSVDHVVCLNVLSNIDNYHRPLERLLQVARKSVILRESLTRRTAYRYVRDRYLDRGVDLRVHVNQYSVDEVLAFIREYGFAAETVIDRRTQGRPEDVIGFPHYWTFVAADRRVFSS